MKGYYIHTEKRKEGPFSVEELRGKYINAETLVRYKSGRWVPAGTVDALKPILDPPVTSVPIKSDSNQKKIPSQDNSLENSKSKLKISALQAAIVVLLIANIILYFYKQIDPAPKQKFYAPVKVLEPSPSTDSTKVLVKQTVNSESIHARNNWPRFIKVRPNDFKFYSALGGIHHLKAIVQNQTSFPVDRVNILIKYIKQGAIYKTEYVTAYDVPAGGETLIKAPNSNSGNSVTMDIIEIVSYKMQFYYHSDSVAKGSDPFFKM